MGIGTWVTAMGNDAPIVHRDGDRWVYRASALGGCETALLAARMGLTQVAPPEKFTAIFADGLRLEEEVIDRFIALDIGWEVLPEMGDTPGMKDLLSFGPVVGGQLRVELPVGECAVIRAHVDALVAHGPQVFRVLEVKAFGEQLMNDFEAGALLDGKGLWEKYRVQLSVMMHATGLPAVFVAGLKVDGEDGERNEKVVKRIHYEYVDKPLTGLGALKARVARVEARATSESSDLTCWQTEYPCPFFFIHATKDAEEEVPVTVDDDALWALLIERARLREQASDVDAKLKTVNAAVVTALEGHGRTGKGMQTRVGDWSVTWMEVDQPASQRKAYTSRYPLIKKLAVPTKAERAS